MTWTEATFGRITLALTALGFALLLALGVAFVWLVQETRSYAAAVVATQQIRVAATDLLGVLQDAETGQRGYLLTRDPAYLAPFTDAESRYDEALRDLASQVTADGGRVGPQRELRIQVEAKMAEMRETVRLAQAGDQDAALAMVRGGRGKALMDEIRLLLNGVEERTLARQAGRSQSLQRTGGLLTWSAIAGLMVIGLVTLGTLRIARSYTRDLGAAQAALQRANASLEQRVQERTGSLMAANEEIQRFAYIVSHDLRAPLVNVMGFTQELETAIGTVREVVQRAESEAPQLVTQEVRDAVQEDIPEAIGFIRSSTNRMDRLIGAILALFREGRRRLTPEPVALQGLLEGISGSLQHQLDHAGAELRLQPPFPTLQTDRLAIEQILGNLLDNATKYLQPGRPGRILVRARREAGMHAIDVVDNGRGIATRDHARVFELFRRSGPQDQKGEGIGLAHTRALARRMGGDIRLASRLGEGSVFTLLLPDALPAPDPASNPNGAPQLEDQPA
ncbi:sensor histidine kinase [Falsiroseomonas tokyonensis]|uniref:histidine kinase n=1 Tax=Falsiroseomonas tokyonensis TaxID=430521 RepID=A0ABV7BR26_9PROT|nr:CHASE3 domain-containing protein [Falsiroseomonas tokyonensis]MBU8538065.1 CHASE3 domain-containing protein [Falsiroseomonas tokyonensis]